MTRRLEIWGHSSAGREPAWHAGGQGLDSAYLRLKKIY